MGILLVHAAELEGAWLEESKLRRLCCGVGKAAAAAALQGELSRQAPSRVLIFGLCGAYPERHRRREPHLRVGDLCLIAVDFLADEGVTHELGFSDLATLGIGEIGPFRADPEWSTSIAQRLDLAEVRGATVSSCSGSEARSRELAARSGAAVETMEGAALAMVCEKAGIPWVQLRCVSNDCGDRERGHWDLDGAADRLRAAMEVLIDEL